MFTGSTALPEPIVFRLTNEVDSTFQHTCFSIVDIPMNIDKEGLKFALDGWRGEAGNRNDKILNQ